MEFFNKAVEVLEAIVETMGTTSKNNYLYPDTKYRVMTVKYPEFTKKMVWVKKHIRPPVRAGPGIRFSPNHFETSRRKHKKIILKQEEILWHFSQAQSTL